MKNREIKRLKKKNKEFKIYFNETGFHCPMQNLPILKKKFIIALALNKSEC